MHDEPGIEAIAVSAPPCGHCRQFLYEFSDGRDIQILLAGSAADRPVGAAAASVWSPRV